MLELVVLKSDGRELLIRVNLTAVNGDLLLADTYLIVRSAKPPSEPEEPFADLFHRIRDVAITVSQHSQSSHYLDTSRSCAAQQLVPEAFSGYLASNSGQWQLLREPSAKIQCIRVCKLRDYELLFVDTIDEQLSGALRGISHLRALASVQQGNSTGSSGGIKRCRRGKL